MSLTPASPRSVPARRHHRVRVTVGAVALACAAVVPVAVPADPAVAAAEAGPHRGAWNGFDLDLQRDDVYGLQVRTFTAGHIYCISLHRGWNSIPVEGAAGAEVAGLDGCDTGNDVPNTVKQIGSGAHWTLDSSGYHLISAG